jgi:hypothetical protein
LALGLDRTGRLLHLPHLAAQPNCAFQTARSASCGFEIPKPVINIPKPNIPRPTINVPRPNVTVNVPKPAINVPKPEAMALGDFELIGESFVKAAIDPSQWVKALDVVAAVTRSQGARREVN